EIEAGHAAQKIENGAGQSLAVVDDDERVRAMLLLEALQVRLGGVEQVGRVQAHRQAELAAQRAEKARRRRREMAEVDCVEAWRVQLVDEAAQRDGFADAA